MGHYWILTWYSLPGWDPGSPLPPTRLALPCPVLRAYSRTKTRDYKEFTSEKGLAGGFSLISLL